jgi:hypothetical protein
MVGWWWWWLLRYVSADVGCLNAIVVPPERLLGLKVTLAE